MSYNESRTKRVRASSAKASNERARPSSGNSNKNGNKIEFIQNMYGGLFSTKRYSNKNVPSKLGCLGEEVQSSKVTQSKTHKQREELVEENLQLKKEINHLKQELNLQKGKTEQMRRKNSEFTKKLNVEYEKEMYWTNSGPNMVRGVKQQYEQMKLKYEQKCLEYDLLTQEYIFSQAREERVYTQILQSENQKLMKRIKQAQEEIKYSQHGTLTSAVEESIQLYKRYKFEIQQQNENLTQEVKRQKSQIKLLKEELSLRDKKISYLDKLLIERDNTQHAAWRKLKKSEKEKQDILNQFADYRREKEESVINFENKVKRMRESLEKQSEMERGIFRNELKEKSTRIAKLEKEIAYLTTLLNNMLENQSYADYDKQVILQYSMGSTMIKYNVSKQQSRLPSHEEQYETKSIVSKSRKGSADIYKNVSELMTKSIDITKKEPERRKRTQITADKRNTEQGVKSRKIAHSEIAEICETLRYRFIGFAIPIESVRKYFDYNEDVEMVEDEEEENWNREYINMKEVNKILRSDVFGLNEADAHTLSRYVIEDSPGDYVYCDPSNQNLRSLVKSIIKNVVGDYSIHQSHEKIDEEARQLLKKYETNLESALKATAPRGQISKKKLVELFKGLGIELSEELEDYFIGKIVIKSQNLSYLNYSILFQK